MAEIPSERVPSISQRAFLSVAIIAYIAAIVSIGLAAPSGPWLTFMGPSPAMGPQFATPVADAASKVLRPLGVGANFHVPSVQTGTPGVRFEARLLDEAGTEMSRLQFPNPEANFWVHHREQLLAQGLGEDQPLEQQLQRPDVVSPSGASEKSREEMTLDCWLMADEIRRLFAEEGVPHAVFAVVYPEAGPKELDLRRVERFYPVEIPATEIGNLQRQGLLSSAYYVSGQNLVAARQRPLLIKSEFFVANAAEIPRMVRNRLLGRPYVLAADDDGARHYFRIRVKEVQQGAVRAITSQRQEPVISGPSPWALLLAKSYARYLKRCYGAAAVELIRRSREPIRPEMMFFDAENPMLPMLQERYREMAAHFGDLEREEESD